MGDKIVANDPVPGIGNDDDIYSPLYVTMSLTLRALLLAICFSICANAQTRTLALYAGPAPGLDLEAALIMRAELRKLLIPADIHVVWKNSAERKAGDTFELLAVSSFEGSCATGETSSAPAGASLADTSISNGHILPFFRIDCTRVRGMLPQSATPTILGRALARVAAHEIYHIVAQTIEHQNSGVAKASLSIQDLAANRLELDPLSLARMRPPSAAQRAAILSGNAAR
jgi:hypothetical protein